MFFLIDIVLFVLLGLAILFSIKKGFTGHFVFGFVKTILSIAAGIGAAVGLYFLFDKVGWLRLMGDNVASFFGNVGSNIGETWNQATYEKLCAIVGYIPLGIIVAIVVYVLVFLLIGLLYKVTLGKCRIDWKPWKIIDNVLGFVLNIGLVCALVLFSFGAIHALNEGDRYKNVLEGDHKIYAPVNRSLEKTITSVHENISAAPFGGFIYEHNPLNDLIAGWFGVGKDGE